MRVCKIVYCYYIISRGYCNKSLKHERRTIRVPTASDLPCTKPILLSEFEIKLQSLRQEKDIMKSLAHRKNCK